jgi:lipopolysaccharide export system permease protein
MISSPTISSYILRQFLLWFAVMFATMLSVIALIDAIELLRRSSNHAGATASIITSMTLLRAPFLAQEAVPFAVMFGAIFTFLKGSCSALVRSISLTYQEMKKARSTPLRTSSVATRI